MEQKLVELKGELGESAIIVGDFNIFLSTSDRTTRQKINKDIKELDTIHHRDLIYRTFIAYAMQRQNVHLFKGPCNIQPCRAYPRP